MTPGSTAGRHRLRPRLVVGVVVAVVALVAVARVTVAATSSASPSYRTAVVGPGTVAESLHRSGTVEPVAQATVAFPVAGTVATVAVRPGDAVSTGQPLASLDTTALQADLAAKQAAVAAAQLTLSKALAGQTAPAAAGPSSGGGARPAGGSTPAGGTSAAGGSRSGGGSTGAGGSTPGGAATSGGGGGASAGLADAQQQVLGGQQQVDADLRTAQGALQAATAACTSPPAATTVAAVGATPDAHSPAGSTTTTSVPPTPSKGQGLGTAACMAAQQQLLSEQQVVSGSQQALAKAEAALDQLLSSAATPASPAASAAPPASPAPSAAGAAGPATSAPAPSAADLVADQAAVDAAAADVAVARQNLDQATIVSPISGTVATVGLAADQPVSAGSATDTVVVVGPGGEEVTTTVAVADIGRVKVGDPATVVPDGTATAADGKVVSIGVAATTSGTTTTYPVVIGFDRTPDGFRNGAAAAVTIEVARAGAALTVPTSAVRSVGNLHVVTVLSGGRTRLTRIEVGVAGAELTEVTSGLQAGQAVVLADLSQPLPSSNVLPRFGAGGGFGGGGGGPRVRAAGD